MTPWVPHNHSPLYSGTKPPWLALAALWLNPNPYSSPVVIVAELCAPGPGPGSHNSTYRHYRQPIITQRSWENLFLDLFPSCAQGWSDPSKGTGPRPCWSVRVLGGVLAQTGFGHSIQKQVIRNVN